MYEVESTDYGIRSSLTDFIQKDEATQWASEFTATIDSHQGAFHVFADMRGLKPMPQDARELVIKVQQYGRQNGVVRSVVILDNAIATMQFQRTAKETGIYEYERYIDAENEPNWEQRGLDWIISAVDPDQ